MICLARYCILALVSLIQAFLILLAAILAFSRILFRFKHQVFP